MGRRGVGAKVNLWMVLGEAAVGPARRCRWRSRCRGIDCHGVTAKKVTNVTDDRLAELEQRLQRIEDERAIERMIASYGPLVDACEANAVAELWATARTTVRFC